MKPNNLKMFWDNKGTAKLKKSINAKTERSEQDIKQSLTPLTVLSVLNFLLLLTLVVR